MRPVTVERQQGDEMVIAQGLAAGEDVVTDGQLRLTPGAQVTSAADAGGAAASAAAAAAATARRRRRAAERAAAGDQP